MSTTCTVRFDENPHGIYESGEVLSGAVELTTVKLKVIRAIYVTINGYAKVRWKYQATSRRRRQKVAEIITCCSNQQYLSSRSYIIGQVGGENIDLPPGKYLYRFQMKLPPMLPSSFEGQYGHIHYEVMVRIDRSSKFHNIFKQPFTVITPLNLNSDPIYRLPIVRRLEKTFWCGICCTRTLRAVINIPMNGYAPGQDINFAINLISTVTCTEIIVSLEKTVCYTSHYPNTAKRCDNIRILEKDLGPFPKLQEKEIRDSVTLPVIPPTLLEACKVIQISYRLKFNIRTTGCHRNFEIPIPITIGTVPIVDEELDNIAIEPTAPHLSRGNSSVSPPSYEEAVRMGDRFVDEDYEKHSLHKSYMPKYPVYYNCKTPSP